jgi:hypothetical protein
MDVVACGRQTPAVSDTRTPDRRRRVRDALETPDTKEPVMSTERNTVGTCRRFRDARGVPLFTIYDLVLPQYLPRTRARPAARRLVSGAALAVLSLLTLCLAVLFH